MKIIYSILTVFCMMCFVTSCGNKVQKKDHVASVKIDTVVANGEKSFLQYPGRVKAAQDIDMSFRVSGKIKSINVKDGQSVRAGQLIAVMDPGDYEVQLAATEAKYNQIKAEAERVMALYKEGGTTPNDYDKAVYGLKQIEALYKHHKDELAYTKLYAPFDGFIQKRYFEAHETVGAGMPVLSLLSNGTPEVEINIPAAEYIRRSQFSRYHCTFDIYPGKVYPLKLIGVTHKANANQLYTMRLKIEVGDHPMPSAGMNTMVSVFFTDENDNTLQLPSNSLLSDDGKSSVYIYNPSTKTVRQCRVNVVRPLNNGKTIITSSEVKAGDIVISAGVHAIKNGDEVRPLSPVSRTNIGGLL